MNGTGVIFTNGFPFNGSEPFFEAEFKVWANTFDKILIVAPGKKNASEVINIPLPKNIIVLRDFTLSRNLISIFESIPLVLSDTHFYREIIRLIKSRKLSKRVFYDLFVTTACGNHRASLVSKWLKKNKEEKIVCGYSYWFNIPAYAAIKLKERYLPNCMIIARAHGFDLYEERYTTHYLPYQELIYQQEDYIATISKNGKEYLEGKYGTRKTIETRYLGAHDKRMQGPCGTRKPLRIVSCARMVKVKRIERLCFALKEIKDLEIIWTHIGDGELMAEIKRYTEQLPANISVIFYGSMNNEEVYHLYATEPFHVFINTSESEGIPVAIMEAMSFGIPVIATDVGGTSELVDDKETGLLIANSKNTVNELKQAIYEYSQMADSDYYEFRKKSREKFVNAFNAEKNAEAFIDLINKMLEN